VTACALRSSSGSEALDAATCAVLQRRARFTPARDKDGKPMAAPAFQTVRWLIPGN
jgi:protein TonB